MITTRQINAKLRNERRKLISVITRNVLPERKEIPKKGDISKPVSINTHEMADVEDIKEKKRRDDIMKQRVEFEKGDMVFQEETGEFVTKKIAEKTLTDHAKESEMKVVPFKVETGVKKKSKTKSKNKPKNKKGDKE